MSVLILISVFIIATCSLIYELLAGTLASYLLGDSVLQFSTVIGSYMFALGIGAWLSKYIETKIGERFVQLEISLGLIGGLSATLLFLIFGASSASAFRLMLYVIVLIVGTLSGLEVPLLLRLLQDKLEFKELVSQVLTLDYIGSLLASVLFPLLLVPRLGLVRTSCLFGIINLVVAIIFMRVFKVERSRQFLLTAQASFCFLILLAAFIFANSIIHFSEEALYSDNIIIAKQSPYQRLIVTHKANDIRLYLNNNLQFSSRDEYRYHEALVHPAMQSCPSPKEVLVLGGGDGMAVREILRHPEVEHITLVDLDPLMTKLFTDHPLLSALNEHSFKSPKVQIINDDAFTWLIRQNKKYDVAIVDFPDPSNFSVGKLYSTSFYKVLKSHLAPQGCATIQCTSPMFARQSFWCIVHTIASVGLATQPYHIYVPSFGEWGYCLATNQPVPTPSCRAPKFLTPKITLAMFDFPEDLKDIPTDINHLHDQALVRYYDREWQAMMLQ
ncbi:polyamine aminopropyltransferase [bacterium]|nr:polyamine aminopropyltransferase [bacterium]